MAENLSYNPYIDMHNDVQLSAMFFGKNIQNIPIFNPTQTIEAKRLYYSLERFTFTGKERDSETGFSYFGARYYDSDILTGWLSVDPLADKYPNISPYAYCAWNPVRLVDPDGEDGVLKIDGKNLTIQVTINYSSENLKNANEKFGYTISNFKNDFKDYLKNTEIDYNGTKYAVSFELVLNEVSGCYNNLESMPTASKGSLNLFIEDSGNNSHNKLGIKIGTPRSLEYNLGGTFAHEILHTLGIPDSDRNPEREEGPLSSYAKKRYPIGKDELLNILTPSLELIEKNNIENGNILIPAGMRIKKTGEWKRNNPEILNP